MIPKPRKTKQREPGEGAFPLEKARKLYNELYNPSGQDITFERFYRELCGLTDEKKMREDLSAIELRRAQEQSNRLLVERGLLHAD